MSSNRVLFVDDDPLVLEGIQRALHKQLDMETASSGAGGLLKLRDASAFAVVVSDMQMPNMDGTQFLAKVREKAPDAVRIMLTGRADLQATIAAVNEGHIFRFICKPSPPEQLLAAVNDGIRQHHLQTAEKVLLEQTLSGAVKMLIEILGLVNPSASGRAARVQRYTLELGAALGLAPAWEHGFAAYVSQIGCVALPREMLAKAEAGQPLSDEEGKLYRSHPEIAGKLLAAIPRLDDVAAIVATQLLPLASAGCPEDIRKWSLREQGALLLHLALEFDSVVSRGGAKAAAVSATMAKLPGLPPSVEKALTRLQVASQQSTFRQVTIKQLVPGMVLDEDLVSPKGIRLVPAGQEVTRTLIVRLTSIATGVGVTEPFRVKTAAPAAPNA